MRLDASECPEHVWASVGVTVRDGVVVRVWDCERCAGWTTEPLDEAQHVPWDEAGVWP